MQKKINFYLLSLLLLFSCDTVKKVPPKNDQPPSLVVFLSIDQMRYDYLERFGDLFTGGFRRLLDQGAVFSNAQHMHAHTGTAPGHASLSTGCHPSAHGILANYTYMQAVKKDLYCVTDTSTQLVGITLEPPFPGASPFRLMRPALGDWLKGQQPASKVYGVALKDRSGVLMAGHKADGVFWFNEVTTRFVSSDFYYPKQFPEWARRMVGEELFQKELDRGWYKKLDEAAYHRCRQDDFAWEVNTFFPSFPHTRETLLPPANKFSRSRQNGVMLFNTPYGDAFAMEFAKTLIKKEQLGKDASTDILFLGCSAADYIGHHFGPMSHEVEDYYLWIDEYLGKFMDFLDEKIGRDRYILLLSSDHGVVPLPEERQRQGKEGRRILKKDFLAALDSVAIQIKTAHGIEGALLTDNYYTGTGLNYEPARAKGIYEKELRQLFADSLKALDFVVETYTLEDRHEGQGDHKAFIEQYRRSSYPGRGYDVMLLNQPYVLAKAGLNGTDHGTTYAYDNHVPVIFYGAGIKAARIQRQIGTIDVAPTIAQLLGIPIPEGVDGQPIFELTKQKLVK